VNQSERGAQRIETLTERAAVSTEGLPAKPVPSTGTETNLKRQRRFAHPDEGESERVGRRFVPDGTRDEQAAPELHDA
jgi:hypothetical protein